MTNICAYQRVELSGCSCQKVMSCVPSSSSPNVTMHCFPRKFSSAICLGVTYKRTVQPKIRKVPATIFSFLGPFSLHHHHQWRNGDLRAKKANVCTKFSPVSKCMWRPLVTETAAAVATNINSMSLIVCPNEKEKWQ